MAFCMRYTSVLEIQAANENIADGECQSILSDMMCRDFVVFSRSGCPISWSMVGKRVGKGQ
jgi:hypothetical protein